MGHLFSKYTFTLLLIVYSSVIIAQGVVMQNTDQMNKNIHPIAMGETIPNIIFQNVLNYHKTKIKLSSLKGKLILLDFWASFCSACIASFPKLEKLQNEFGDKIQILLCNPHSGENDTEGKILELLLKNKNRTGFYPTLPIPIGDSILNFYFPHFSLPHIVWINDQGVVIAVTGAADVTSENINSALNNKNFNIVEKNDFLIDERIPLYIDGNGGEEKYIFRTILTPYIEGVGTFGGIRTNKEGKVIGAFNINFSIKNLINDGFHSRISKYAPYQVFYDVKDPQKFEARVKNEYKYCYDISIPPIGRDSFNVEEYLRYDLKKYFNVSLKREQRKMKYFQIAISMKGQGVKVTKDSVESIDINGETIKKYIKNVSEKRLVEMLSNILFSDIESHLEIGHNERISIEFPDHIDFSDKPSILNFLRSAGFRLTEVWRDFDVLIITDK